MEQLPAIKLGDRTEFEFGELVYRATVYNGKIIGLKIEQQITTDTTRNAILKDLIEIAAATELGKEVAVLIRADKQGAYRITRTETKKIKHADRGNAQKY